MSHLRADGRMRGHVAIAELRPALTDISGACRYLGGISRAKLYADLLPELEVVHIGTRALVTVASLDRLIAARRKPDDRG